MHDYKPENWRSYFKNIGVRPDLILEYLSYVEVCRRKNVPPIFESEHLAQLVGINVQTLMAMVYGSSKFYRSFSIPKRTGGRREIVAPYPSLLHAQRWIKENILDVVPISSFATGYAPGKSIVDNARLHCGRAEVFKMDLKDFFPSVKFDRVIKIFCDLGYPVNVAFFLSRLCTLDGSLPQGAATSPVISNIICRRMDVRFYKICKKRQLRYTRYADDIVISGQSIPNDLLGLFFSVVQSEGFEVNEKKIRLLRDGDRKIVTGLDITNGYPRVSRDYRREVRRDVYHVWASGLAMHVSRRKIFDPNYLMHLEGKVNFWAHVEPDCTQMKIVRRRLLEVIGGVREKI